MLMGMARLVSGEPLPSSVESDYQHLVAAYTETTFAVAGQLRVRALPDEDFSGSDELAELVAALRVARGGRVR